MSEIRVFFVICDEGDEEDRLMLQAFKACEQDKLTCTWIKERDVDEQQLDKKALFVFKEFGQRNFDKIINNKAAVLGPWVLIVCLLDAKSIPPFLWPIYNVALYGCCVTSSHLSVSVKKSIGDKVLLMAGTYEASLSMKTTHVIVDSVKSTKYMHGAEMGLKIMLPQWIDVLWDASKEQNVHGNDDMFDKYKCPPFHKLVICTTGFTIHEKEDIEKLVVENGGNFTSNMNLRETDFLICGGTKPTSTSKYIAARNTQNIQCVNINWLHESIEKGYCLPHENYSLSKIRKCSTPTHEFIDPNFSAISAINSVSRNLTHVNATVQEKTHCQSQAKRKAISEFEDKIEGIDVKRVKRCGTFLDGYSLYLVGFNGDNREKLCRIINACGATRLDDMSDRVTHVIVCDNDCDEVKVIKSKNYSCSIVNVNWLFDSIEAERACKEDPYLITTSIDETQNDESAISCIGLSLLRSNKTITETDKPSEDSSEKRANSGANVDEHITKTTLSEVSDDDTIANYLKNANFNTTDFKNENGTIKTNEVSSLSTTQISESANTTFVFRGLKFFLSGFAGEEHEEITGVVKSGFGTIVKNMDDADFLICPSFVDAPLECSNRKLVNDAWIYNTNDEQTLVDIAYYHRPYYVKNNKTLEGCVIGISGYEVYERFFLNELVRQLGGVSQEVLTRKTIEEKGILKSTHLVTANMDGQKYNGALKWKLPVVSRSWLMKCLEEGYKVPEKDYEVNEDLLAQEQNSKIVENIDDSITISSKSVAANISATTSKNPGLNKTAGDESIGEIATTSRVTQNSLDSSIADNIEADELCSQVTPVKKIMEEVRRTTLLGTPKTPKNARDPWDIETPETPYENLFTPNPSKSLRKLLKRKLDQLPDRYIPPRERRLSTPLSELKRRFIAEITQSVLERQATEATQSESNSDPFEKQQDDAESEYQSTLFNSKLDHLEQQVLAHSSNKSSRRSSVMHRHETSECNVQESQPNIVQWDFGKNTQEEPAVEIARVFIISGVSDPEEKEKFKESITKLGGVFMDSFDENVTHLLCSVPQRNEKTLCCMGSGKWILHINYIENSLKEGKFLNEEDYEFGNPNSLGNIPVQLSRDVEARMQAIYHWRREIERTGKRPLTEKRFIVFNQNQSLVQMIKTCGGLILEEKSQFCQATHCIVDQKGFRENSALVESLAKKNIPCLSIAYINDYLHRNCKEETSYILEPLKKYYK